MTPDAPPAALWALIAAIGLGTWLLRFSFLGLMGGRRFPPWAERVLRYAPVAVLPALVAPGVLWPAATGGAPDATRLIAAAVTVAAGMLTRNVLAAIVAGGAALGAGVALGL